MRKYMLTIALLAVTMMVSAQKYEPNTKWPYIYQNFTKGTIFFEGNMKNSAKELNIHLWGNKLHYLAEDGRIYQSDDQKVIRVEIGDDAYIFSDHKLVKILANKDKNLLVMLTKANFDALQQGSGAYGSSLNSSAARDLSSLDLGGLDKPELGRMLQEKNDGSIISIRPEYYLVINGEQVEATKKGLDKYFKDSKPDEWKAFLKANKIKWKDAESLAKILDFIQ